MMSWLQLQVREGKTGWRRGERGQDGSGGVGRERVVGEEGEAGRGTIHAV